MLREFAGNYEKWAAYYCQKNCWRTLPLFDFHDLMQEAFLVFRHVEKTYPDVTDEAHLLSLFRTSLTRRIHKLAYQRSGHPVKQAVGGEEVFELLAEDYSESSIADAELLLLLEDAPKPIANLIESLVIGEERPRYMKSFGVRETTQEFLQRVAEVPNGVDMKQMLKRFLSGERHANYQTH